MRLAIITTHPVQYYAPFFKALAGSRSITIKVYYTWGEAAKQKFDPGFEKEVEWDVPLLEGYDYEWAKNTSADAGSHHFKGIVNPGLTGQIKLWQPDALLVYGWAWHGHLKAMRYFKNKIPVYFRGDSTLLDTKKGARAVLRYIFLKWVYRHADHAFYTGTNNKTYYKKHGLKDHQLSFAPHAVDNDRFFADRAEEAASLRRVLGIGTGDTLVLFAGKFEQKKSPRLLLDAFLALDMPDTHLLLAGSGTLEDMLKTTATGKKNVHFMPFQNQTYMPVLYQACDLFCLPSGGPGETWGLAVNEAMASGKPVLVSDKAGCAADLVVPGFTGDIFRAEDIQDMGEKLRRLTADKAWLKFLGANAKKKIHCWSFACQADAIEKILVPDAK